MQNKFAVVVVLCGAVALMSSSASAGAHDIDAAAGTRANNDDIINVAPVAGFDAQVAPAASFAPGAQDDATLPTQPDAAVPADAAAVGTQQAEPASNGAPVAKALDQTGPNAASGEAAPDAVPLALGQAQKAAGGDVSGVMDGSAGGNSEFVPKDVNFKSLKLSPKTTDSNGNFELVLDGHTTSGKDPFWVIFTFPGNDVAVSIWGMEFVEGPVTLDSLRGDAGFSKIVASLNNAKTPASFNAAQRQALEDLKRRLNDNGPGK